MDCINKVVSKLFSVVDGKNKAVAEVIENPGCGFEWLIRIDNEYKYNLNVFIKCMEICKKGIHYDSFDMNEFYKKGYPFNFEEIALVNDKII